MEKCDAINKAFELAKVALEASPGSVYPTKDTAENVADFIETLTERILALEPSHF